MSSINKLLLSPSRRQSLLQERNSNGSNSTQKQIEKLRELRSKRISQPPSIHVSDLDSHPSNNRQRTPNRSFSHTFDSQTPLSKSRSDSTSRRVDNSASKRLDSEISILRRQYQTTLQLLYESNIESSKLRVMLDYTSPTNYEGIQNDIIKFISKKHTEYQTKHFGTSRSNDVDIARATAQEIYTAMIMEKELRNKVKEIIALQSDIDEERKRADEAEYAMSILRDQYNDSLNSAAKLKQQVKDLKRLVGNQLPENKTIPNIIPKTDFHHHCPNEPVENSSPSKSRTYSNRDLPHNPMRSPISDNKYRVGDESDHHLSSYLDGEKNHDLKLASPHSSAATDHESTIPSSSPSHQLSPNTHESALNTPSLNPHSHHQLYSHHQPNLNDLASSDFNSHDQSSRDSHAMNATHEKEIIQTPHPKPSAVSSELEDYFKSLQTPPQVSVSTSPRSARSNASAPSNYTDNPMHKSRSNSHNIQLPETDEDTLQPILLDLDLGDNRKGQVLITADSNPLQLCVDFLQQYDLPQDYLQPLLNYVIHTQKSSFPGEEVGTEAFDNFEQDDDALLPTEPDSEPLDDVEVDFGDIYPSEHTDGKKKQQHSANPSHESHEYHDTSATVTESDEHFAHSLTNSLSQLFLNAEGNDGNTNQSDDYKEAESDSDTETVEYIYDMDEDRLKENTFDHMDPHDLCEETGVDQDNHSTLESDLNSFVDELKYDDVLSDDENQQQSIVDSMAVDESDCFDAMHANNQSTISQSEPFSVSSHPFGTSIADEHEANIQEAKQAFEHATELITHDRVEQAVPLYDHALSIYENEGFSDENMQIMEEEVMYWMKQAAARRKSRQIL